MKEYELMFIVAQTDLKQSFHEEVIEDVRKWVEAAEGRVLRVRPWGLRQLAYDIDDFDHGYYVIMQLLLGAESARELEDKIKSREKVLRHILLLIGERESGEDVDVLEEIFAEDEIEKIALGRTDKPEEIKVEEVPAAEEKTAPVEEDVAAPSAGEPEVSENEEVEDKADAEESEPVDAEKEEE